MLLLLLLIVDFVIVVIIIIIVIIIVIIVVIIHFIIVVLAIAIIVVIVVVIIIIIIVAVPEDPPTNIQVSIVNSTSVFLSWSPPLTPNGLVVIYTLLVEEYLVGENVTTIVVMGTSLTVVDLIPYTFYNFSVSASTRIGEGPHDVVSTRTPQDSKLLVR